MSQPDNSQVARLLAQIEAEYLAATRGLSGLAAGVSKHAFITAKSERVAKLHNELVEVVGDDHIATRMVIECQNKATRRKPDMGEDITL